MQFIHDDGGREAAGFKGSTGDCACRAIAIATGRPYREVYDLINEYAKRERTGRRKRTTSSARGGVFRPTMRRLLADLGWEWVATMRIGSGCRVHMRADELPGGPLIVNLSRHYAAVVDGVLRDTYHGARDGRRCVYGYWRPMGARD